MPDVTNDAEFTPSTYTGTPSNLAKFSTFIWHSAVRMRANEATDERVAATAHLVCHEDAGGKLYGAARNMVPELRGENYYTTPLEANNQLLRFVAKVNELCTTHKNDDAVSPRSTTQHEQAQPAAISTGPKSPGGFWRTEVASMLTMLRPLEDYTDEEKLAIEDVVQILEWMHADRTTRSTLSSLALPSLRKDSKAP